MEYQEAISRLLSLVDHERTQPAAPRQKQIFDLRRMEGFLELLGRPHQVTPTIHVAGTKGKGSTAAFCDSVLNASGYQTGFYSSPHMHSFCERIRRNTQPVSPERFSELVEELWPTQQRIPLESELGEVSLFEFMTGMAFHCFAQDKVDFQTIEVGLGGRLDATNVVKPEVAIITSISLDHTAILGETLAEIASEKAGIVKPNCHVVVAPQHPEAMERITAKCAEQSAVLVRVPEDVGWRVEEHGVDGQRLRIFGRLGEYQVAIPLLGSHQQENATCAVAALEILQEKGYAISGDGLESGLAEVRWPCRMEVLSKNPLIVCDGAHNPYSIRSLLASLPRYLGQRKTILVAGFSRDKQIGEMAGLLANLNGPVYATRSRHPRSVPPEELAGMFREAGARDVTQIDRVSDALAKAQQQAGPTDLILATGSLFVAAEARESILDIEPEIYPDLLPPDLRVTTAPSRP